MSAIYESLHKLILLFRFAGRDVAIPRLTERENLDAGNIGHTGLKIRVESIPFAKGFLYITACLRCSWHLTDDTN